MSKVTILPTLCPSFQWNEEENICQTCGVGYDDTADEECMEDVMCRLEEQVMDVANRFIPIKVPMDGVWTFEFQSLFEAMHINCGKFNPTECIKLLPGTESVVRMAESVSRERGECVMWVRLREFSETGDQKPTDEEDEKQIEEGDEEEEFEQADSDMKPRFTLERCFKVSMVGWEKWKELKNSIKNAPDGNMLKIVG